MSAQYPPFGKLPHDVEILESTYDWEKAKVLQRKHALALTRLAETDRFAIRIGHDWGEYSIIVVDRTQKSSARKQDKEGGLWPRGRMCRHFTRGPFVVGTWKRCSLRA